MICWHFSARCEEHRATAHKPLAGAAIGISQRRRFPSRRGKAFRPDSRQFSKPTIAFDILKNRQKFIQQTNVGTNLSVNSRRIPRRPMSVRLLTSKTGIANSETVA